ncbi:MAG: Hsp20/alpha crystallin family protein [Candidatus Hodarchaeales archaeon]|jgi:HSP20 family molecular chaperone IbpA
MEEVKEEVKEEIKEEIVEKTENDKYIMSPEICSWADDETETYKIEIQLPGAEKDSIKLKMHEDSFFIKGETDDTIYIGTFAICCPVKPEEAEATYHQGLLKIEVPFKESEYHSIDVKID